MTDEKPSEQALREALTELVALKNIRDKYNKSRPDSPRSPGWEQFLVDVDGYQERDDSAWRNAAAALAAPPAAAPQQAALPEPYCYASRGTMMQLAKDGEAIGQLRCYGYDDTYTPLYTAAQLLAFRAQAVLDAERYQWLRRGKVRTTGTPKAGRIEVCQWEDRSEGTILKGAALDAAIDAAIRAMSTP